MCYGFTHAVSWGAFHVHSAFIPCEKRAEHPWGVTGNAVCCGVFYMSWAENLVALESILEEGECQRCLSW